MVLELSVENIAIIDRAQIALGPGFTALTGETGAGKSLLVDAIDLALGGRADSDLVRSGASRGHVSLVADVSDNPAVVGLCKELGVELEDGQLFVQREVSAEGRSTCRIGGKLTPVGTLRQIGALLVDLHGQHDHQALLDPARHLESVDAWIGEEARSLIAEVVKAHAEVEELRARLRTLQGSRRDRERRLDLVRYQIAEIEAVAPTPGEMEELLAGLSRLQHVERLAAGVRAALEVLSEREDAAREGVAGSLTALEGLIAFDPKLEEVVAPLRDALYALEESVMGLSRYADGLESDPAALEAAAARIDALKTLRRKYGDDEAAVLTFLDSARAEFALLENAEEREDETLAALAEAESHLVESASRLTALRTRHAARFSDIVRAELADLAMQSAVFETRIEAKTPDATGADRVEFFFSANAGEPVKPLSKIASGGEISRVMLALKVALAGRAGVPTLIFDEVDAGLGGRAAASVARKLEQLAEHDQVVVISHLPQIACRATTHYRIEKIDEDGRTVTRVRRLDLEERIEEIARMLAGERVSEPALANARELLGVR